MYNRKRGKRKAHLNAGHKKRAEINNVTVVAAVAIGVATVGGGGRDRSSSFQENKCTGCKSTGKLYAREFFLGVCRGMRLLQAMVLLGSIPRLKWRDSLKACCRSKQQHKLVTRSYSHSNRLMAQRSKYVYRPRSMENSYTEYLEFLHGISATSMIEVS
jgi:hypothetical protein